MRLLHFAVISMILASVIPVRAATEDATRLSCGRHLILLDLHRTTPIGLRGDPTRLRVYRGSQMVWSFANQEAITETVCRSLTGDGVPGVVFTTFSYGAHCCTEIFVLSLRSQPKLLLRYWAGNAGRYDIRDLNADNRLELILGDDSFAYFGGLCYACSPSWLPLVACYRSGMFVDCNRQFPVVVRASIDEDRADLKEIKARSKSGQSYDPAIAGLLLGIYANSVVLGQDSAGWTAIRSEAVSKEVLEWLECHRPTVQRWAKRREEILHRQEDHWIWTTPGCRDLH